MRADGRNSTHLDAAILISFYQFWHRPRVEQSGRLYGNGCYAVPAILPLPPFQSHTKLNVAFQAGAGVSAFNWCNVVFGMNGFQWGIIMRI